LSDNWKEVLARIRGELPKHKQPIAKRRHLTRKEVVTREIVEICRISNKVVRKRRKKINIEAKLPNYRPKP
jgi:hypothetical protein